MTTNYYYIQVGNALRFLRLSKSYHQTYIANAIACKKSMYSKIESGQFKSVSIDKFDLICTALGIKTSTAIDLVSQPVFKYKINSFEELFNSLEKSSYDQVFKINELTKDALPTKHKEYKHLFEVLLDEKKKQA